MRTAMPDPIDDLAAQIASLREEVAALRAQLGIRPNTAGWELRERGLDDWIDRL